MVLVVEGRFEMATGKTKRYKTIAITYTTACTIALMMAHFFAFSDAACASAYRP